MKPFFPFIFALLTASTISSTAFSQNQAMEDQKRAFGYMFHTSPMLGYPATEHMYMKASFGGNAWSAIDVMPDRGATSVYHVYGTGKGQSVDFTVLMPEGKAGYTGQFSESSPVHLIINDHIATYTATSGSYTITKIDTDGFECSFHCTAVGTRRKKTNTVEITDGYLRCPFLSKQ